MEFILESLKMELVSESLKMAGIGTFIFLYSIFLFRIGKSRIRLKSPFDFVVLILIGSLLSRPINSNTPLIPTLFATLIIVFIHHLLAWIAYKSDKFGDLIKGKPTLLVSDGNIQWKNMKECKVTQEDLISEARKNNISEIEFIKAAHLERDGNMSFIKK